MKQWLNSQASPHTRSCYQRDANRLLAHTKKRLKAIDLGDLQDFAESLVAAGLAPVSRLRTLAAVRSLFGFCQRMRYLPANPAQELALPAHESRLAERILPEEDLQRVLAVEMGPRDRVLLQLLYTAGLRVSEACGLRWRNLSARGDAGQITVLGKGGRTRAVALPPEVWNALNKLRKSAGNENPVFVSKSGKPLDRGRVRVILRRGAEIAGVATKPLRSAPTGCGMPTPPTPSTMAHRFIWSKPRSATVPWPPPAPTCMPARAIPAPVSCPPEK